MPDTLILTGERAKLHGRLLARGWKEIDNLLLLEALTHAEARACNDALDRGGK